MPFVIVRGSSAAVSMGMDKNADHAIPGATSQVKVTGWTARSGYPNTVIGSDELVSSGSGNVTVQCGVSVTGTLLFQETRKFELMLNDTVAKTVDSASTTVTFSATALTVAAGDRIWLRVTGSTFASYTTTVKTGTSTFIYFDVV